MFGYLLDISTDVLCKSFYDLSFIVLIGFNIYSFLIGGVVGAVIVILCVAILLYK